MRTHQSILLTIFIMIGYSAVPDAIAPFTRMIVFSMDELADPVVVKEYHASTTGTDHNLYIRGQYMYQSNYQEGIRVIDIGDPEAPHEVGYFTQAGWAWGIYPFLDNDVVAVSMNTGLFLVRLLPPR